MEYYYNAYSKKILDQKFFFVKKFMRFSEFKDVSDFLEGYGMHPDFNKACDFAGINDPRIRRNLLNEMQEPKEQQPAKVIDLNQAVTGKTASR
ncbi:MAG: hypothetical protein ABJA78_01205 [Ferruginibacter sp.]